MRPDSSPCPQPPLANCLLTSQASPFLTLSLSGLGCTAGAHDDALATAEWPNAEFVVLNTASAPETTIMLMACATFRFIVFSPCVMLSTEWQVRFQRSAPSPIGLSPTLRMATVLDALARFAFHRFLNS